MTTIIAIFSLSLIIALLITPLVAKATVECGLVDVPTVRKIHSQPIPRTGGVAIYLAFYFSFIPIIFYRTTILDLLIQEPKIVYLVAGAVVAFGLGLWDDIRRIKPELKLGVQIIAALIAYSGGVRIVAVGLPGLPIWILGWLSLPFTLLWILLVMNGINLIDGLDGLAAGVSFFVCIVLLVLCVLSEQLLVAVVLAGLSGATLGFLRYNFNPASIFLGDSGSYFLGYMLATMSIQGSIKSQAAATILIPIIALGLPLIDTVWSAARRFIFGRRIFHPDKEHIHHMLLKLGYSHRRAVLLLYGITVAMGMIALVLIHAQNERAALILLMVGAITILGIRKLGYFNYLNGDRIKQWAGDISDEMGLSRERRYFLGLQADTSNSKNIDELWHHIIRSALMLGFDMAALCLNDRAVDTASRNPPGISGEPSGSDSRRIESIISSSCMRASPPELEWTNPSFVKENGTWSHYLMKLELPLLISGDKNFGTLVLCKDLRVNTLNQHVLKRVEHLIQSINSALEKMETIPQVVSPSRTTKGASF